MKNRSTVSRIVVKFRDCFGFPEEGNSELTGFLSRSKILDWQKLITFYPGISIETLFPSIPAEKIRVLVDKARLSDPFYQAPDFQSYFSMDCPVEIRSSDLLQFLKSHKTVELAYNGQNTLDPSVYCANNISASLCQGYLNPAPDGIDAKYAWGIPGGDGKGNVRFIDIEKGWILDHESFKIGTFHDTGINRSFYADHGAAVLGVIMMDRPELGAMGVTPKAKGSVISQFRPDGSLNTADAILTAIDHLSFGDVLLLEAQLLGSTGSEDLLPVEIQDAVFSAIRLATALGIVVVEAGGNGNLHTNTGNDFDKIKVNGKKLFNPVSLDFKDSGAIIVAAASKALPHRRMSFSNYGSRMNCFAWGESVLTAGNYPQSSGFAINTYTGNFGGTSGAAAIVAGAAIAVQSIMEANQDNRLGPNQMRHILSDDSYGTPSANGRSIDKIGVMPDLKKIIDIALAIPSRLINKPSEIYGPLNRNEPEILPQPLQCEKYV